MSMDIRKLNTCCAAWFSRARWTSGCISASKFWDVGAGGTITGSLDAVCVTGAGVGTGTGIGSWIAVLAAFSLIASISFAIFSSAEAEVFDAPSFPLMGKFPEK